MRGWSGPSWYASADGNGKTIGSVDSTETLAPGTSEYVYLTTGSVAAPEGVHSARVRVMLVPKSASAAILYLDDLVFGPATAPPREAALLAAGETVQEEPPQALPPPEESVITSPPDSPVAQQATTAVASPALPEAKTVPATLAAPATALAPVPEAAVAREAAPEDGRGARSMVLIGLAAALSFVVAIVVAYLYGKRPKVV